MTADSSHWQLTITARYRGSAPTKQERRNMIERWQSNNDSQLWKPTMTADTNSWHWQLTLTADTDSWHQWSTITGDSVAFPARYQCSALTHIRECLLCHVMSCLSFWSCLSCLSCPCPSVASGRRTVRNFFFFWEGGETKWNPPDSWVSYDSKKRRNLG